MYIKKINKIVILLAILVTFFCNITNVKAETFGDEFYLYESYLDSSGKILMIPYPYDNDNDDLRDFDVYYVIRLNSDKMVELVAIDSNTGKEIVTETNDFTPDGYSFGDKAPYLYYFGIYSYGLFDNIDTNDYKYYYVPTGDSQNYYYRYSLLNTTLGIQDPEGGKKFVFTRNFKEYSLNKDNKTVYNNLMELSNNQNSKNKIKLFPLTNKYDVKNGDKIGSFTYDLYIQTKDNWLKEVKHLYNAVLTYCDSGNYKNNDPFDFDVYVNGDPQTYKLNHDDNKWEEWHVRDDYKCFDSVNNFRNYRKAFTYWFEKIYNWSYSSTATKENLGSIDSFESSYNYRENEFLLFYEYASGNSLAFRNKDNKLDKDFVNSFYTIYSLDEAKKNVKNINDAPEIVIDSYCNIYVGEPESITKDEMNNCKISNPTASCTLIDIYNNKINNCKNYNAPKETINMCFDRYKNYYEELTKTNSKIGLNQIINGLTGDSGKVGLIDCVTQELKEKENKKDSEIFFLDNVEKIEHDISQEYSENQKEYSDVIDSRNNGMETYIEDFNDYIVTLTPIELIIDCDDFALFHKLWNAIIIIAPFLVIIFGSIDYFKVVVAIDEDAKKQLKKNFPKRIIAFILLILVPTILFLIFSFFDFSDNKMLKYAECIISGK